MCGVLIDAGVQLVSSAHRTLVVSCKTSCSKRRPAPRQFTALAHHLAAHPEALRSEVVFALIARVLRPGTMPSCIERSHRICDCAVQAMLLAGVICLVQQIDTVVPVASLIFVSVPLLLSLYFSFQPLLSQREQLFPLVFEQCLPQRP